MARVGINEGAWAQFALVAQDMQWDLRLSAGAITMLWHQSQRRGVVNATAQEICRWAIVREPTEQGRFIQALIFADLIRPGLFADDSGELSEKFRILGNEENIAAIQSMSSKAQAAGEANKKKWEERKALEAAQQASSPQDRVNLSAGRSWGYPEPEPRYREDIPILLLPSSSLSKECLHSKENLKSEDTTAERNADASVHADVTQPSLIDVPRGTKKSKKPAKTLGAIPELAEHPFMAEALSKVSQETQRDWLTLYAGHEPWMVKKIQDLHLWAKRNAHKAPKVKFDNWFSNILASDFEKYRKGVPSNHLSRADQTVMHNMQMRELVEKGQI